MALGKFHPEYYDFSSLLWIVFLVNSRGLRFCATLFLPPPPPPPQGMGGSGGRVGIGFLLSSNLWGELAEFLNNF